MKERLLGFIFCAVFVAFAVNLVADKIHGRLFSESLAFQTYWYVPFADCPCGGAAGACLGDGLFPTQGAALGRFGGAAGHRIAGLFDPGRGLFLLALLFLVSSPANIAGDDKQGADC